MSESMGQSQIANCKYLRLSDLAPFRHGFFTSRRPVEGRYAGRHMTAQRGHSVEFTDYRAYTPGDELADVDWKAFARTDRLFVKLFEHQSDMAVHLLVDASASMAYGGETGPTKFDHAARLAAAIAFLVLRQQDQASIALAQNGLATFVRPAAAMAQLPGMLDALESATPAGSAQLADALRQMAPMTARRSLLVVLSDLLDDRDAVLSALALYRHRGSDAVVFQVLHADELDLPRVGPAIFEDSETAQRLRVTSDQVRDAYRQRMTRFIADWRNALRARGISHTVVSTATPYTAALRDYLVSRAATA